jgi:indole-3-acetate monooxygenase
MPLVAGKRVERRSRSILTQPSPEGSMPDTGAGTSLLEVARTFRPRLLAERDRIEASRRLPEDVTRELACAGFFRIFLPRAYGGLDLTPIEAMEVFEELARADASVAWCMEWQHSSDCRTTLP